MKPQHSTRLDIILRWALLAGVSGVSTSALAQTAPVAQTNPTAPPLSTGNTLGEVVVTAQRRQQNLQDVPIAVTALSAQTLVANRVENVADLNAIAPALTVETSAGGSAIPAFGLRGALSFGAIPGSDKEVSQYIDGVYIGSALGSVFDLPDVSQIEVLKGPQGTLFGRDATAGAISITTHTPTGKLDFHQELTGGNYDQFRSKTRLDLPAFGDVSASITYLHNQRTGDIDNLGAGTRWDYTGAPGSKFGVMSSPSTLGDQDANAVLGALRYHPNSKLDVVYKFDWSENHYTPEGVGETYQNFGNLGPAAAALTAIVAGQPNPGLLTPIQALRPSAVNNDFTLPSYSVAWGHNLTLQYKVDDHISVKDIGSYREAAARSAYELDGFGGVTLGGTVPFVLLTSTAAGNTSQWSNEIQVNANYRYITITAGYLHYHATNYGGDGSAPSAESFAVLPNYKIPATNTSTNTFIGQNSDAGYIQGEAHLTSQLDLIGGYRYTHDTKTEIANTPGLPPTSNSSDSKPSYLIDLDYKPFHNALVYGKYSTAFMSGGAAFGLTYAPETAQSYEIGGKADFLDHRLRTDLSIYEVTYKDVQQEAAGVQVGLPAVGALLTNGGSQRAAGFDFEGTALPMRGLTLGLGTGYTNTKYLDVSPFFGTTSSYIPASRPHWTVNVSAQYDTEPLYGPVNLSFRVDTNYRSREALSPFVVNDGDAALRAASFSGEAWMVNVRVAAMHLPFAYGAGQIALWARNLNNDRSVNFADPIGEPGGLPFFIATSYRDARTYGIDVSYDF